MNDTREGVNFTQLTQLMLLLYLVKGENRKCTWTQLQLLMLTTCIKLHRQFHKMCWWVIQMNIHFRACLQSVHHQHALMISDGHVSIDDIPVKVWTSLYQAFLQVVDVMNLCFMHALLYNTHISKFQAHDDPGPLWWSYDTCDAIFFGNSPL